MVPLLADDVMRTVLNQAKELAEVRDAGGKLLGYFVPADLYQIEIRAETATAHTDTLRSFQGQQLAERVFNMRQSFEHWKRLPAATDADKADLQPYLDNWVQEDLKAWEDYRAFIKRSSGGGPPSSPQG